VSYRERKVLGPESSGWNRQRQGNGYGGSGSRGDKFDCYGNDGNRSRPHSCVDWRTVHPRARVVHEDGHGRSLTHGRDHLFSCSRDMAAHDRFDHCRKKDEAVIRGANQNVVTTVTNGGESGNAPAVLTQVSVVFYITNFPNRLLYVDLRKGLEVCGIMSDVYVSLYRNIHGQHFGFVKFLKVRDVAKLNKALNNGFFGDLCLFVNVAKFDRFVKEEGSKEGEVGRMKQGPDEGGKKWWIIGWKKKGVEGRRSCD